MICRILTEGEKSCLDINCKARLNSSFKSMIHIVSKASYNVTPQPLNLPMTEPATFLSHLFSGRYFDNIDSLVTPFTRIRLKLIHWIRPLQIPIQRKLERISNLTLRDLPVFRRWSRRKRFNHVNGGV